MRANRGSEKLLDGQPYEPLLQLRFGSNGFSQLMRERNNSHHPIRMISHHH
jgi:hypothetical protein